MVQINTTNRVDALWTPTSTRIDRDPRNKNHIYACMRDSATLVVFYRSTDNGASWSLFTSQDMTGLDEVGPIYIDSLGYLHWVCRTHDSTLDRVNYRRLRLSDATWVNAPVITGTNGGTPGSKYTGMDLIPVSFGSGYATTHVLVAVGTNVASTTGVGIAAFTGPTGGAIARNDTIITGTRVWLTTAAVSHLTPAMDLQHTTNPKAGDGNHIWLAFGRTRLEWVKLAWNGHGWNGPTSSYVYSNNKTAWEYVVGRYDGSRFVMAIYDGGNGIRIIERNKANTSHIVRNTPVHPQGVVRSLMIGYNSLTRDLRVYAVGTSTGQLYYIDFDRVTGLWSTWTQVNATALTQGGTHGPDNFQVLRGTYYGARYDLLLQLDTADPNQAWHVSQSLSFAPTVRWSTIIETGEAQNGAPADVGSPLLLDWVYDDPDENDTQSGYSLSRQIGAGSVQYYTAATNTWGGTEIKNNTATTRVTLPAGWGADSDATHTYKVKVYDTPNVASAYSDAMAVVPSAKVNPTISTPTVNAVVTAKSLTPAWTAAEQTAWRVRLLLTSAIMNANPYFETDVTNWSPSGATSFVRSSAQFHSGGWSGLLTPNGVSSVTAVGSELRPVIDGQPCQVSTWGRCAVARDVVIGFNWYDAGSTFMSSTEVAKPLAATTWTFLALEADAPSGAAFAQLKIAMTGTPPAGNTLHIDESILLNPNLMLYDSGWRIGDDTDFALPYTLDDLTSYVIAVQTRNNESLPSVAVPVAFSVDFVEPPAPTLTVTPLPSSGIVRCQLATDAPLGNQPATDSIDLYRRQVLYANQLANIGFEVDTVGWTAPGCTGTVGVRSATQKRSGGWSYFCTPDGTDLTPRAQMASNATRMPVDITKPVVGWGWVRPTTANKPARVRIQTYDSSGTLIATRGLRDYTPIAGAWLYLQTRPVDLSDLFSVTHISVSLGLSNGGGAAPAAGDTFYVDDAGHTYWDDSVGTPVRTGLDPFVPTLTLYDAFTRVSASDWGGIWTRSGGLASEHVITSGFVAQQIHPAAGTLRYDFATLGANDGEAYIDFRLPALPVGAPVSVWLIGRMTDVSNYWVAQLSVATTGVLTLEIIPRVSGSLGSTIASASPGTLSIGQWWRLHMRWRGGNFSARTWTGAGEPAWQATGNSALLPTGQLIAVASRPETGETLLPYTVEYGVASASVLAGVTIDDWGAVAVYEQEWRAAANGANDTVMYGPWTR